MLTPQKKVSSPCSLTPRRENQKTPAGNSNSNGRVSENGGNLSGDVGDLEDLDEKVAKLENEVCNSFKFVIFSCLISLFFFNLEYFSTASALFLVFFSGLV